MVQVYSQAQLPPSQQDSQDSGDQGFMDGIGLKNARHRAAVAVFGSLLVLAPSVSGVAWATPKPAPAPHPILAAKQAYERQDIPSLSRAKVQLSGDPLAVWPHYWNARLLVAQQPFGALAKLTVASFEQEFPGHPLVQTLKNDWLLAGVRGKSWPDLVVLLRALPEHATEPTSAKCARARLQITELDRAALQAVLVGRETNEGCLGLLEAMAEQKLLEPNELILRARWASLAGEPKAAARIWKAGQSQGVRQPSGEQPLLNLLALSRANIARAASEFANIQGALSQEQRAFASLAIASRLWLRTDLRAWSYLSAGLPSADRQPPDVLEAAARLALRRADARALDRLVNAMPPTLQASETWAYWRGWLAAESGQNDKARQIWSEIPQGWSFYRLLAAEALGRAFLPEQHLPQIRDQFFIEAVTPNVSSNPFLHRSLALSRLGLRSEAVVEWNALTQQLNDNGLLAASRLALDAGQPDRAIAAAIRTQNTHDFSLRYPKPFIEIIAERAEEKGLSPGWVMGLIRQESRFLTSVQSPVGATGLMQLMPQTAQSVARSLGMARVDKSALSEPGINVRLGTAYLRDMKERFEGSAVLASAAYNAGPSRSHLWRSSLDRPISGAAFAESIPFTETRDYVKQVLANTVMYEALLSQQAAAPGQPTLSQWLSEIRPRAASATGDTRVSMTKERR
ncbi:MAG: hypothetical protein FJY35_05385 [Betaproteobacteria bacterium]|nr:hypothetical protein [Betaproteobacteria bacterium]